MFILSSLFIHRYIDLGSLLKFMIIKFYVLFVFRSPIKDQLLSLKQNPLLNLKSHVLRLVWRLLKKYCRLTIIPVAGKFDGFSDQFRTWHNPHGCCNSWTRNICGEVGDHQSHQIESKSCRLGAFGIVVCKTQCLRHQSRTRPQCCSIQCRKCSFQRCNYQLVDNQVLKSGFLYEGVVPKSWIMWPKVPQMNSTTCCTFITRFQSIACLEQKTLHVIGRIIIDTKHGEEFTLSNLLAFPLARPTISNVMKVNVHHIVQGHRTRPIAEWTVIIIVLT